MSSAGRFDISSLRRELNLAKSRKHVLLEKLLGNKPETQHLSQSGNKSALANMYAATRVENSARRCGYVLVLQFAEQFCKATWQTNFAEKFCRTILQFRCARFEVRINCEKKRLARAMHKPRKHNVSRSALANVQQHDAWGAPCMNPGSTTCQGVRSQTCRNLCES